MDLCLTAAGGGGMRPREAVAVLVLTAALLLTGPVYGHPGQDDGGAIRAYNSHNLTRPIEPGPLRGVTPTCL